MKMSKMNKNDLHAVLHDLAEQKMPPAQINLWPALQARIQLSDPENAKGQLMNIKPTHWQFKPAYLLAALLLAGALTLAFPQGRAWAQDLLHFFRRGESSVMPGAVATPAQWVEQTPGVAGPGVEPEALAAGADFEAACGPYPTPHCTLDEIRSMLDFPVFALAQLPEGMKFAGATGGPQQVHLFYQAPDQSGWLTVEESPFTGDESPLAIEVGADAEIQTVQVGAVQGEFVQGSYDGNQSIPVWNSDLDLLQLRWVDQGVYFSVVMHAPKLAMQAEDLAALAQTLTDGPVPAEAAELAPAQAGPVQEAVPADYELTLEQAAEAAGFTPVLPARLPEQLVFIGGRYDAQTGVVEFLYSQDAANSIVVREQLASEDCALCGFVQGSGAQVADYPAGKLVSEAAAIEAVDVLGQSGEYIEGAGWVLRDGDAAWQWVSDSYAKRLRLRSGELAIEIAAYSQELDKADLTAVAESLK